MMSLKQRQPLIHQFIFVSCDCFLFEENRADCWLRNGVVFLTKEVERLTIKVLQSAGVEISRVALAHARASDTCTLPNGRVSAASDERSFARIMDEGQQISFVFKKDDSAK